MLQSNKAVLDRSDSRFRETFHFSNCVIAVHATRSTVPMCFNKLAIIEFEWVCGMCLIRYFVCDRVSIILIKRATTPQVQLLGIVCCLTTLRPPSS